MAAPEPPIYLLLIGLINSSRHINFFWRALSIPASNTSNKRWLIVVAFFCLMAAGAHAQNEGEPINDTTDIVPSNPDSLATDADTSKRDQLLLLPLDTAFGDYAFRKRSLDGEWSRLDTIVRVAQLESFARLHRPTFGALPLSNIGHAVHLLKFSPDSNHTSDFAMGTVEQEFRTIQELPFFDVKTPVADMQFITGYGRGQHFRLNFTQNLGEHTNYFISYDRVNSLGNYPGNRAVVDDLIATIRHESPNRRFQAHFAIQFNQRKLGEYGGIAELAAFEENSNTERATILTNLSQTRSAFLRNQYFGQQRYVLFRSKSDFLISVNNQMTYTRRRFALNAPENEFLPPAVAGHPTTDTIGSWQYDQSTGVSLGKELPSGARQDLRVFAFYHYQELGGNTYNQYREAFGFGGEGNYQDSKDRLLVQLQFRLNTFGNQAGSLLKGSVRFGKREKLHFTGNILVSGRTADPFWETYRSNHYNWLNEGLQPVRNQRIALGAQYGENFGIEAAQLVLQNWMYLDTLSLPAQARANVFLQQITGRANFKLGRWDFENQAMYQNNISGGYDVVRLPQWVLRSTIYYNYSILKGVLHGQIGVDAHYFSAFQMNAYNPVLARFHIQDAQEIGNFPYVHAFVTAQLKSFQFFLRFENVTPGLSNYNYFAAPFYPLPDRFLRLGFNWRFFE